MQKSKDTQKSKQKADGAQSKPPKSSLIHSMPMESEGSRIYLRHPGDEEEEGLSEEEDRDHLAEEESKEEDSFKKYLAQHQKKLEGKMDKS